MSLLQASFGWKLSVMVSATCASFFTKNFPGVSEIMMSLVVFLEKHTEGIFSERFDFTFFF